MQKKCNTEGGKKCNTGTKKGVTLVQKKGTLVQVTHCNSGL